MSRITDVRAVGYGVQAFDAERAFYAGVWGLQEMAGSADEAWFSAAGSEEPYVVHLRRAAENHLGRLALATGSRDDVDALHDKLAQAGCQMIQAPGALSAPGGGYGLRCFTLDGLPLEISSDVARHPAREVGRSEGIPIRLSHIVLHSPKPKDAVAFFTEVLGFRISDWLGDFMCFLRCNSAHHRVAILPGPPCLNHVAYDMQGVDGMMRGIGRLRQAGIELRWGPGRHVAGDNTFSYFQSPGGFAVEYTAELQQVDFETYAPTVYPPSPSVMDQWGVGVGGPQSMPHAAPDPRLFQPLKD